jgi:hypothetical protein
LDYLTTHTKKNCTSLSPIRHGFAPGFVNYKKVYQLLAHGRWFSPDTPASSTTKTGLHDIVEILLKVVLNTINQIKSKSVFSTKLGNGLLNLIFDLVFKTHTNELFILRYCTVLYVTQFTHMLKWWE